MRGIQRERFSFADFEIGETLWKWIWMTSKGKSGTWMTAGIGSLSYNFKELSFSKQHKPKNLKLHIRTQPVQKLYVSTGTQHGTSLVVTWFLIWQYWEMINECFFKAINYMIIYTRQYTIKKNQYIFSSDLLTILGIMPVLCFLPVIFSLSY